MPPPHRHFLLPVSRFQNRVFPKMRKTCGGTILKRYFDCFLDLITSHMAITAANHNLEKRSTDQDGKKRVACCLSVELNQRFIGKHEPGFYWSSDQSLKIIPVSFFVK